MSKKEIDWTALNKWQRDNKSIAYGIVTTEYVQEVLTDMGMEGKFSDEQVFILLQSSAETDEETDGHDYIIEIVIERLTGEMSEEITND